MDTVVYKLHNASKYPLILSFVLDLEKEGKGVVKIPKSDIGQTEKIEFQDAWINLKMGTIFFFNYNVKMRLPSSATGIQVMHDQQKDLIKFEFSVPKFLFANNVCEIIPPFHSKHYTPLNPGMLRLCCRYWYSLLKTTFKKIIFELTNGIAANFSWTDVQLSRIDICFNQIFKSKDDAKFYLESIKRVRVPKGSEKMYHCYDTSVDFNNPRYYWKIYHKGSEFSAVGANQVRTTFDEFNKDARYGVAGKEPLRPMDRDHDMIARAYENIDQLQEYADRILRYELECKGGLMSYLFNRNLKKKAIKPYKSLWKAVFYLMETNYEYTRECQAEYYDVWGKYSLKYDPKATEVRYYLPAFLLDKDIKPNDPTRFKLRRVIDPDLIKRLEKIQDTKHFLEKHYGIKDLRILKKVNKFLQKEQSKYHQFFFDVETVDAATANPYSFGVDEITGEAAGYLDIFDETDTRQKFTPLLLSILIKKFLNLFDKFQFEKLPTAQEITLKVRSLNKDRDTKISTGKEEKYGMRESTVQMIYELLKHYTWDDLKKSGKLSRKTIYNYKQRIAKLEGLNASVNFIEKEFTDTIIKDRDRLYSRHYDEMVSGVSPLHIFLNSQNLLLV